MHYSESMKRLSLKSLSFSSSNTRFWSLVWRSDGPFLFYFCIFLVSIVIMWKISCSMV